MSLVKQLMPHPVGGRQRSSDIPAFGTRRSPPMRSPIATTLHNVRTIDIDPLRCGEGVSGEITHT